MTGYESHLRSPLWSRIKGDAAARSLGLCELCKAAAKETHHIKYPKGYANDNAQNVLHVCSACHRRLHGMNQLVTDRALTELRVDTFKNRPAVVWIDECRWVWAPLEQWERALLIPSSHRSRLFIGVSQRASLLKQQRGEPFELPDDKGSSWFRWAAINDGLLAWYFRTDARRQAMDLRLTDDDQFLFDNVSAIRAWGDALQERALGGAMRAAAAKEPSLDNAGALAQAMGLLAGVTQDHERRLVTVEQAVHRDPDEFIDARSFVAERGLAGDRLVAGTKQTIQQWLGIELSNRGAAKGAPVRTRIEGCSAVATVNTYRRRDLAAQLNCLPKD